MALKFVTAKTGEAHISSADWKSLNRGLSGTGKYMLEDTSNNNSNDFFVSATQGKITIPPRSFLWSGAHIRNTNSLVIDYVPPTVSSTVNVWFHYLKDADSGIESLETVVTVDNQPSPIIDEIEDGTLEAYTLILSFFHNVESTTAENVTLSFLPIQALDELNKASQLVVEALSAEKAERESADYSFESQIALIQDSINTLKGGLEVLAEGLTDYPTNQQNIIFTSTKSLSEYRLIVLLRHSRTAYNDYKDTLVIPARAGVYKHNQIFIEDASSITDATKVTEIPMQVQINVTTSGFTVSHTTSASTSNEYYSQLDYYDTIIGIY